jgi:hypothetical protein
LQEQFSGLQQVVPSAFLPQDSIVAQPQHFFGPQPWFGSVGLFSVVVVHPQSVAESTSMASFIMTKPQVQLTSILALVQPPQ